MYTKIVVFIDMYFSTFSYHLMELKRYIAGYFVGALLPILIFPSAWPVPLLTYLTGFIAFLIYHAVVTYRTIKYTKAYRQHEPIPKVPNSRCMHCGLAQSYWDTCRCIEI
jgi:hypothetical protein